MFYFHSKTKTKFYKYTYKLSVIIIFVQNCIQIIFLKHTKHTQNSQKQFTIQDSAFKYTKTGELGIKSFRGEF